LPEWRNLLLVQFSKHALPASSVFVRHRPGREILGMKRLRVGGRDVELFRVCAGVDCPSRGRVSVQDKPAQAYRRTGTDRFREGFDRVPWGRFTSEQTGDFIMIDIYGGVSGPALQVPDPAQPPVHYCSDDNSGPDLEPLRGFRDVFPAVLGLAELNSAPQQPG